VSVVDQIVEAIAATYERTGAHGAGELIVLCGSGALAAIKTDIKARYTLMHDVEPTLSGTPPSPLEIMGVRVEYDPWVPRLNWIVQHVPKIRTVSPCPVCGSTTHESLVWNGVTVTACPDAPRDRMVAFDASKWDADVAARAAHKEAMMDDVNAKFAAITEEIRAMPSAPTGWPAFKIPQGGPSKYKQILTGWSRKQIDDMEAEVNEAFAGAVHALGVDVSYAEDSEKVCGLRLQTSTEWSRQLREKIASSEQEDRDREARQCGWDPMGDY
jgi:hypothetical protein